MVMSGCFRVCLFFLQTEAPANPESVRTENVVMRLLVNKNQDCVVSVHCTVPPLLRQYSEAAVSAEESINFNVSSAICFRVTYANEGCLSPALAHSRMLVPIARQFAIHNLQFQKNIKTWSCPCSNHIEKANV